MCLSVPTLLLLLGWNKDLMAGAEAAILGITISAGIWHASKIEDGSVPAAMESRWTVRGPPYCGLRMREI